jgi:hypothetical protein
MVFTSPEQFSKYMSMMRLFGYDVIATSAHTGRKIHNWADNASGRYIYVADPDDIAPRFVIDWKDVKKRDNCWMELPTMYGQVTFSYELGPKALTWFSGDSRMAFSSEPITSVRRSEFQRAVTLLTQAKPSIKIVPLHRRSDFRTTQLALPVSRPALAPGSSQVTGTEQIDVGVDDPDPTAEGMDPADE